VIHLRVVSPPDVTGTLMPLLRSEPAVLNLMVLPGAVAHPDGDAVHFDVLHGAANDVIGRLRDLGLDQRGSIVLENVDTSISAHADRATARRGRYHEFTPVWAEVESRITLEGTFPPSWYALLVIAGLIGAVGILTNSQILIVGAMVVGPEYGAILSLAFGVTRRDSSRMLHSAAALALGFTLAVAGALLLALIIRGAGLTPKAYSLGLRPVSDLIDTPNWFSVIVALLARGGRRRLADRGPVGYPDRRVHLGDHHPGRLRHRRVAGLRQRKRGPGLGASAPAQRHRAHRRRDRRSAGAAGHLAAGRPP
jgi:hypothetical protein